MWEPFHALAIAFKPLYQCIAFPSWSQTRSPEEMQTFFKNATSLHVLQRFGFDSQQLGGFESGEIFNHVNTSAQAKEERRGATQERATGRPLGVKTEAPAREKRRHLQSHTL